MSETRVWQLACSPSAEAYCGAAPIEVQTHQGRCCYSKTAMQTLPDSHPIAREERRMGEAASPAAPGTLDLPDTRHARSMTVRSDADFYSERSPDRLVQRGGYREGNGQTRAGAVELCIPRQRAQRT